MVKAVWELIMSIARLALLLLAMWFAYKGLFVQTGIDAIYSLAVAILLLTATGEDRVVTQITNVFKLGTKERQD